MTAARDREADGRRRASAFSALVFPLYLLTTLAGLYLFRGIPVFNVGLGFVIGAAVVLRETGPGSPGSAARASGTPAPPRQLLQQVLWWALATAAFTMLFCWLELGLSALALRNHHTARLALGWIPLFPPPSSSQAARAQFFAIVTAPLLQVLTTCFGGLLAILLSPARNQREMPSAVADRNQGL